jgi:tetratricopeptide (TPR) repeat protein
VYVELGWNYAAKGSYGEAVANCQKGIDLLLDQDIQAALASCAGIYAHGGRRTEALGLRDRLRKLSERRYVDPYNIAWLYDGLGEKDEALKWLNRAYDEKSASMWGLKIETFSDSLRSDPRFQDLLRRMNFPP